jgi:hypothetical protein
MNRREFLKGSASAVAFSLLSSGGVVQNAHAQEKNSEALDQKGHHVGHDRGEGFGPGKDASDQRSRL